MTRHFVCNNHGNHERACMRLLIRSQPAPGAADAIPLANTSSIDLQLARRIFQNIAGKLSNVRRVRMHLPIPQALTLVLYVEYPSVRMQFKQWIMDDSSYRLNFDLGKKNEMHHYC